MGDKGIGIGGVFVTHGIAESDIRDVFSWRCTYVKFLGWGCFGLLFVDVNFTYGLGLIDAVLDFEIEWSCSSFRESWVRRRPPEK